MSRVLYIQADSRLLNPVLDQQVIDEAYRDDPAIARAEWGGEFRDDISAYLTDELIDAAMPGRLTHGRRQTLAAFCDMSGGVNDASVLAVAHSEVVPDTPLPIVVLDRLQARDAPHEPDQVVGEFAKTLKDFRLSRVVGDRYSAQWVVGAFQKHGVRYEPSELDKSGIYNEVAPMFAERRIELLDDRRLLTELRLLERRPRSGGRADAIDHAPRAHDDRANAAAGALWMATVRRGPIIFPDDYIKRRRAMGARL